MSVIYNAAVKTDRMTATMEYFANGSLEILDASDTVLATFGLSADAGAVAGAVWTLEFDAASVTASASGTASKAQIKNSAAAAHLTGLTVGTSGSDINLTDVSLTSGQTVTLSSATITHAT